MVLTASLIGAVIALFGLVITIFMKTYDSGKVMGALQEKLNNCEKEEERLDQETHALRVKVHELSNDVHALLAIQELSTKNK
jgi:uncharacterized protein YoxC